MTSGRPLEECDLTQEDFAKIISMYRDGASDVEVKAYIWGKRGSFSNDLWDRWLKDERSFSETIRYGKALSATWWEKNGRQNLTNKEFNAVLWYMNMKNRFGWRDRVDSDITSGGKSIPLLGGKSDVQGDDSDTETSETDQED